MMNLYTLSLTLSFHFALVSITTATRIRGSSSSVIVASHLRDSDCDGFAQLRISDFKLEPEECRSHGFKYLGMPCTENMYMCVDKAFQKVLLSVANVEDPSLVYYEKHVEPGFQFQISTAEEDIYTLPKEYTVTIFACDDGATACDTVVYGEIIQVPCGSPYGDLKSLSRTTSGVQLVFVAHSPTMVHFQVETESHNGNTFSLNSLAVTSPSGELTSHRDSWSDIRVVKALDGSSAEVSFPWIFAKEDGLKDLTITLVAELTDSSSGHRCYSETNATDFLDLARPKLPSAVAAS